MNALNDPGHSGYWDRVRLWTRTVIIEIEKPEQPRRPEDSMFFDVEVVVTHFDGIAQTWFEPGEPSETYVDSATRWDADRRRFVPFKLTDEQELDAIERALEDHEHDERERRSRLATHHDRPF